MTLDDPLVDLLTDVERALGASPRTQDLAARVPAADDASPLRIAFAGPTNAGKSLLVGLLAGLSRTALDARVSALPETSGLLEDPWGPHTLLDMPGTMSGLLEHEEAARRGVRQADLLVLVTTVELPGEQETAAIRRLLSEDGFLQRCLLVVNKINLENNDPDVIEKELRTRLGDADGTVPLVFVDAGDRREALHGDGLTDADRQLLDEESGFNGLEAALAALVQARSASARAEAQREEVRRLLAEAADRWGPTDAEAVQDAAAARLTASLDRAGTDLNVVIEHAVRSLQSRIASIGSSVADAVHAEDGSVPQTALDAAQGQYDAALTALADELASGAEPALARLVTEMEATASHEQRRLADFRGAGPVRVDAAGVQEGPLDEVARRAIDRASSNLAERLEAFGSGGTRAGAPAHDLARSVNKALRAEPRAYVHINRAEQLTKAAKGARVLAEVAGPLLDLKQIVGDDLRRGRIDTKRADIRAEYQKLAADLAEQARADAAALVARQLGPYRQAVAPVTEGARARQEERAVALAELAELAARASQP